MDEPVKAREGGKTRTIRLRLTCPTQAEFERQVLPRLSSDGLFIPTPTPPAPCERVNLKFELQSGQGVCAEVVAARPAASGGKAGFIAQLIRIVPPPTPPPPPPAEPEQDTCVHHYSSSELRESAGGTWTGGLRPFDRLGRYQLLMRLGAGNAAEVFLARCQLAVGVERLEVLKVLRPELGPPSRFASLFASEAHLSLTLQHQNLVRVLDCGQAQGRPFLSMEYVEGCTLADLSSSFTRAGRLLPVSLALRLGIDLCRALEYVHAVRDLEGHSLNLVHRDVRPGNVLVSEAGEVKLLDFGVVASALPASGPAHLAPARPALCPEQARGAAPTPAWDVYALGALLDQLLTLRPLYFLDPAAPARLPPSSYNPRVPPAVDRAVLAATELDPERRLKSARELRELLEQAGPPLTAAELGALCRTMLGTELSARKREIDRLLATARRRDASRVALGRVLLRSTKALPRRPRALLAGAALLVFAATASGWMAGQASRAERDVGVLLAKADREASATPAGLESLLAARRLRPDDERVVERLRALAAALVGLAEQAERRGNAAQALAHLEAALEADPTRPGLAEKVRASRARGGATARSTP